jgi:hypothetical protein
MTRIQVTVSLGDKQVTLDGPEDFVRAEVQRITNLLVPATSPAVIGSGGQVPPTSEAEFVSMKKPSGHPEIVAVLAYLLAESGQNEFSAEDIRRAYARAKVRPPKVIEQSLRDAKNVRDFLERGSTRGKFRLTLHGRRTVEFDLPRKEP